MHMADALISPEVGGAMWAATAGLIGYSARKLRQEMDDRKVPLMGVLGAFIFAAQMINFTIPATGSSGHIGGGMILAILLGPYAAFLVMASVLIVQALFFADGGLLALGCNIFNLGFWPCFVVYPLIYRKIVGDNPMQGKIMLASIVGAIAGLQLGAFGVVMETVFSRISELPFKAFVLLMQPIHLAIGIMEGFITAAVVAFVWRARPEILDAAAHSASIGKLAIKRVLLGLLIVTVITGGTLSWFASSNPDGLEWAMFKTSGTEELESHENIHISLAQLQEKTAFLPDYGFKQSESAEDNEAETKESWPSIDAGTSTSGLIGGTLTLLMIALIGLGLKRRKVNYE